MFLPSYWSNYNCSSMYLQIQLWSICFVYYLLFVNLSSLFVYMFTGAKTVGGRQPPNPSPKKTKKEKDKRKRVEKEANY